jgi:hypothetical protein
LLLVFQMSFICTQGLYDKVEPLEIWRKTSYGRKLEAHELEVCL